MKLKSISGRPLYKNVQKYRIDWDKKSKSKYQFSVKKFLEPYWSNQIVYEEFPVYGSRMTLDFFNATKKLAIEMQGEFHTDFSEFAHKNRDGYWKHLNRDRAKYLWCEANDITLIEVFPHDLPLSPQFFKNKGVRL